MNPSRPRKLLSSGMQRPCSIASPRLTSRRHSNRPLRCCARAVCTRRSLCTELARRHLTARTVARRSLRSVSDSRPTTVHCSGADYRAGRPSTDASTLQRSGRAPELKNWGARKLRVATCAKEGRAKEAAFLRFSARSSAARPAVQRRQRDCASAARNPRAANRPARLAPQHNKGPARAHATPPPRFARTPLPEGDHAGVSSICRRPSSLQSVTCTKAAPLEHRLHPLSGPTDVVVQRPYRLRLDLLLPDEDARTPRS